MFSRSFAFPFKRLLANKMSMLIPCTVLRSIKKAVPYQYIYKQRYTTYSTEQLLKNENERLRLREESYCQKHSSAIKEPYKEILKNLSRKTQDAFSNSHMMISPSQAQLLHQLVALFRPEHILEIGGFTGYSAIAMGSALSSSGKLTSLELDPEHIAIAEEYIRLANLGNKINIKQGLAIDSLNKLAVAKTEYDFVFLDADKGGYIRYYEAILENNMLSERGVIIVDNVLFHGQVHLNSEGASSIANNYEEASKNKKKTARKVHLFNEHVVKDPRVEMVMLPIYDGLSFIRKKN